MEIGVIGNDMFTVGFRAVGIDKWFNVDDENNVDETKGGTQVNELDSKEAKSVNRKEVEDFANEYADTKPIGF